MEERHLNKIQSPQKLEKNVTSNFYYSNHKRSHYENISCDICGQAFSRADSIVQHKFAKHGQNRLHFCHMEDYYRGGYGLYTHYLLMQHLDQRHHGATLADNDAARQAAKTGQAHEVPPAVQHHGNEREEETEDADAASTPETDLSETYESQIFDLVQELDEERKKHAAEVA